MRRLRAGGAPRPKPTELQVGAFSAQETAQERAQRLAHQQAAAINEAVAQVEQPGPTAEEPVAEPDAEPDHPTAALNDAVSDIRWQRDGT